MGTEADLLFEVGTPIGFRVQVTRSRWRLIAMVKHPVIAGREQQIKAALESPDEVRQSRSHPAVFLFYRRETAGRWTCAVARRNDEDGFLVTAYPTDAIKEGVRVWPK
ncbi:MAG: hypothetical protein WD733_05040 [Bryobacterales bacterium]